MVVAHMCLYSVLGTVYGMSQRIGSEELELWVTAQENSIRLDPIHFHLLWSLSVTQKKECQSVREHG